jgi:hypothetical protein
MDSISAVSSDRRMQDNTIQVSQDLTSARYHDGMSYDTFRSTGVADSYPANPANTDLNGPAFPNADNPDLTNSMDTSDAHPANGVDMAADATDAEAFLLLSQGDGDLMSTDACEIPVMVDSLPDVDSPPDDLDAEGPAEQSIEFDSNFSDASSVAVDSFPFGNPGAPIPGVPQEPSSYEQFRATQGNIWAPFRSQRDWDIARWAKTHGTTSSAVAELLALPGVSAY